MSDHMRRCVDCGSHHDTYTEAVECDVKVGRERPGTAHTDAEKRRLRRGSKGDDRG